VVKEAEIRRRDSEQQAQADVRGALIDLSGAREQLDAATERLSLASKRWHRPVTASTQGSRETPM